MTPYPTTERMKEPVLPYQRVPGWSDDDVRADRYGSEDDVDRRLKLALAALAVAGQTARGLADWCDRHDPGCGCRLCATKGDPTGLLADLRVAGRAAELLADVAASVGCPTLDVPGRDECPDATDLIRWLARWATEYDLRDAEQEEPAGTEAGFPASVGDKEEPPSEGRPGSDAGIPASTDAGIPASVAGRTDAGFPASTDVGIPTSVADAPVVREGVRDGR